MEIAASIKGASKEYKTGNTGETVITSHLPTTFDLIKKELSLFNEKQAELFYKQIEMINNSGSLSLFIKNL